MIDNINNFIKDIQFHQSMLRGQNRNPSMVVSCKISKDDWAKHGRLLTKILPDVHWIKEIK